MMQKSMIIYLHSTNGSIASWISLDENNSILESVAEGDLNQLSVAKDCDVYVVVPAQDVLLTQAELPKLTRQRLLQALPFALEEQLIDDVNDLHFAIGDYQADGTLPVAVVSKQKMTFWLNLLEQRGIAPQAFIPAIFALPVPEHDWQINTYDNQCVIRTGKMSGFACEQDNLETLLKLKLAELPENQVIDLVRTQFSYLELLEKLANTIQSLHFINLLQGVHQAKPQSTKIRKIWFAAGYILLACIALAFISNIFSFFILHHQANKLETEINQIYKRNFPQASSVVAPRERMAEKLRTVSGQASKNNIFAVLGKLGKSMTDSHGVRIQNLDFREQQLTLEVSAATFDNLDSFIRVLTQQGLTVKQQNAAAVGTQVKATLLIRAGTS